MRHQDRVDDVEEAAAADKLGALIGALVAALIVRYLDLPEIAVALAAWIL